MRNFLKIAVFILLLQSQLVWAMQVKPVVGNDIVQVTISATELSRLEIKNDRISTLRGVDGAYTFNADEKEGVVYIKPTIAFAQRPFSVHVTTEKGHHYRLLLTPKGIPAESILLIGTNTSSQSNSSKGSASSYLNQLAWLMKQMANHAVLSDYTIIEVAKSSKADEEKQGLVKRLITTYQGENWRGRIFELYNGTAHVVKLSEHNFSGSGILAIALGNHRLNPGSSTSLFVVQAKGAGA